MMEKSIVLHETTLSHASAVELYKKAAQLYAPVLAGGHPCAMLGLECHNKTYASRPFIGTIDLCNLRAKRAERDALYANFAMSNPENATETNEMKEWREANKTQFL